MRAKPYVFEFAMGVDVHGDDATKAACRTVSDAIRHSSLPFLRDVRERGGMMLVDVTVGVPEPKSVDIEVVRRELPHGGCDRPPGDRRPPGAGLGRRDRVRGDHGERHRSGGALSDILRRPVANAMTALPGGFTG